MRTDRLTAEYDLQVRYTHFPLHPDTPPEGQSLEHVFADRPNELAAMRARLPILMAKEGLDYGDRSMTYNSRLAQEVATWAETQPAGRHIHIALFKAYFVDGVNLADPDMLVAVCRGVGLSVDEVRAVITERRFRSAVDRDWHRSLELGVTGVPAYVIGDRGFVGAQAYEVLEELVTRAGVKRKAV